LTGSHEFVGKALVRFERSTLQEHQGTKTVVLRFLKIITPVKCVMPLYDDYIHCPKEGELYRISVIKMSGELNTHVWSVDVEKLKNGRYSIVPGLRLLWESGMHSHLA
jgi:hypothetical protein